MPKLLFKITIFGIFLSLLNSCGEDSSNKVINSPFVVKTAVKNAKITLYKLDNSKIYETTTNRNGEWVLEKSLLNGLSIIKIIAENGVYKDINFNQICSYEKVSTLLQHKSTINIASSYICSEIDSNSSQIIEQKISSINQKEPYLETLLLKSDAKDVLSGLKSWQEWKSEDFDNDSINNKNEIDLALDFTKEDSDFDTLSDAQELYTFNTKPNSSDSDSDFIPDNIEIANGSDPLNMDEDNNGIKDGLEGDPFFKYQWYIYSPNSQNICTTSDAKTVAGNDLGVLLAYHYTLGNNRKKMIVQVVDGGVDSNHSDLDLSLQYSINSVNGTNDPSPTEPIPSNKLALFYRGHGTAVAGIIGAKGFNSYGIRGVAPMVKIAGSNWLESEDLDKLSQAWLIAPNVDELVVSNNSWGTRFINETSYETIIKRAIEEFRGGKGRIFVFASGNERKEHVNANLSYLINNPYVVTVAALNTKDEYASYSTPGSNVFISAYGGEYYYNAPAIISTFTPGYSMYKDELAGKLGPITVDEDTNRNFTYGMNGTSSAAPMVSADVALVLNVCPNLSWRDIKWLMATTAKKIDSNNSEWVQNSAKLWHNNNYGFGKIDAYSMIQRCTQADYTPLGTLLKYETQEKIVNLNIPDNNTEVGVSLNVDEDIIIEWVAVILNIDHPYAGDLDINLISPSNTKSHLMEPNYLKSNAYLGGFRFSSYTFLGEHSKGVWHIKISDKLPDDSGKLISAKILIWGHKSDEK